MGMENSCSTAISNTVTPCITKNDLDIRGIGLFYVKDFHLHLHITERRTCISLYMYSQTSLSQSIRDIEGKILLKKWLRITNHFEIFIRGISV